MATNPIIDLVDMVAIIDLVDMVATIDREDFREMMAIHLKTQVDIKGILRVDPGVKCLIQQNTTKVL